MISLIKNRKNKDDKPKNKNESDEKFLDKLREKSKKRREITKFLEEYYTAELKQN